MFVERLTKFTERLTKAAKKVFAECTTSSLESLKLVYSNAFASALLMVTVATIIVSPSILLILGFYILIVSLVNADKELQNEENEEVEKVNGGDTE